MYIFLNFDFQKRFDKYYRDKLSTGFVDSYGLTEAVASVAMSHLTIRKANSNKSLVVSLVFMIQIQFR